MQIEIGESRSILSRVAMTDNMTNNLYLVFLTRLYKHCQKGMGRTDIRTMVSDRLSYDACYSFMQWAEQDKICSLSVQYDCIIIWIDPEICKMKEPDFLQMLKRKFNKYYLNNNKKHETCSNYRSTSKKRVRQ